MVKALLELLEFIKTNPSANLQQIQLKMQGSKHLSLPDGLDDDALDSTREALKSLASPETAQMYSKEIFLRLKEDEFKRLIQKKKI